MIYRFQINLCEDGTNNVVSSGKPFEIEAETKELAVRQAYQRCEFGHPFLHHELIFLCAYEEFMTVGLNKGDE